MRQLQTNDILQLQLVCKDWKAACTEFCGSAAGFISDQQAMLGLCAALPNLSKIELATIAAEFDLSPLAALSNLEDVALYHKSFCRHEGPAPTLEFGCLPLGLRRLKVSCFEPVASGLSSGGGSFACLTSFVFAWRYGDRDVIPAMWKLLVNMPNLKVFRPLYTLLCPDWDWNTDREREREDFTLCSDANFTNASAKTPIKVFFDFRSYPWVRPQHFTYSL